MWCSSTSLVAWVMLIRHPCLPQHPLLRDECGNRNRGGQSGDYAAGPGHEEDGAMRRQATRWTGQWERFNKTFRWAAQWEEMCMLDKVLKVEKSLLGFVFKRKKVFATFYPCFSIFCPFYCMYIYLLMLTIKILERIFFSFLLSQLFVNIAFPSSGFIRYYKIIPWYLTSFNWRGQLHHSQIHDVLYLCGSI